MARKNKGSHIKTRVIKRIDPDATIDSIVSFLRQIVEEGLRAKKEYLVPKLTEREQPESLQYTRKLNKAYEELLTSDQFLKLLLPADVVNFFIQIKNSLSYETPPSAIELLEKLERDHQLSQSQARVLISFESERALAKSFKSTDARAAARSFLKKLSPDEKEEVAAEETEELEPKDAKPEAESPPIPSPTPTPAKDKIAGDGGAPTSPQTEEVNLEEVQRALLGPNADRTISSLTTISLNSVLLAYTSNEGLEGITYDRLDPVLQQALFNQVHAKIENFILGLSAEERAQLVNQGEFALRAKLLRQTHFFLKTDPQARILLQTALETHYQQLHQAGGDTHELAQQLEIAANTPDYIDNQLAEEAQGEDLLTDIEQINLNNLNNSDDYRIVFAENLKIVLELENVGEAARARDALDNSIASLILSDPLLSPRFVDNLSPSQLEFFLQTRVGEGGFFVAKDGIGQTRIKALRELIKQYWTIHRAKYFRKLSDNESEIAEANANYRHLKKDQAEEVYTKTFVATVQRKAQSIKNSSEEEDGAHKVLSKLSEEGGPARHKGTKSLYWSQLSKEKKKIYMRYVYGSSENIDNISENKAIEEFQYLKYLQALNEAITIQAIAQTIKVAQATEIAQAVDLQLLLQESAQIQTAQQDAVVAQKYQVFQALSQAPIQAQTDQALYQNHFQTRIAQAEEMGEALLDKGMDFAIDAGLNIATDGAYEGITKIPVIGPIIDELVKKILKDAVKERFRQIKIALQVAAASIIAILSLLLAFLAKVIPLLGAVIGGIGGAILGGPVGAVVGATAGGIGSALFTGKAGDWWRGIKKIAGNKSFQQSANQTGRNLRGTASDLASHGRSALQSPSQQALTRGLNTTPAQQTLLTNLASNPFAASLTATISVTAGGAALVFMMIQAAFLANFPYTGVFIDPIAKNESRYVQIEKTASINCSETENNTCPDPSFPVKAEYRVEIRPKEDYILTITNITDEVAVEHNKKHYQDNGETVPLINREPKTFDDFSVSGDDLTVNPDETLVLTYSEKYNSDYNHANVRNKISIEFNYSNSGGSGQDSASTFEVIRLGEYPKGRICWPTSGRITQGPYDSFSHSVCDAYDVAPQDGVAAVHPIYAVADGELCAGRLVAGGRSDLYNSVYGNHLSLQTEFDGETYVFIYGHLADGTAVIQDGCEQTSAGTIIGYMGNTGESTGVHLHFERRGGYNNSYSLTRLLPGGDLVEKFPNNQYVTSCYEGGFND